MIEIIPVTMVSMKCDLKEILDSTPTALCSKSNALSLFQRTESKYYCKFIDLLESMNMFCPFNSF